MNKGLNEDDKGQTRTLYRNAYETHSCKVAWGGITHLGRKLTKSQLSSTGNSLRLEAVMQGIGDDNNLEYAPHPQRRLLSLRYQTIIPSKKATKIYLKEQEDENEIR